MDGGQYLKDIGTPCDDTDMYILVSMMGKLMVKAVHIEQILEQISWKDGQ